MRIRHSVLSGPVDDESRKDHVEDELVCTSAGGYLWNDKRYEIVVLQKMFFSYFVNRGF